MPPGNRSRVRARPQRRSRVEGRRSTQPARRSARLVRIYNGDPGLRLDRRGLIAVLRCLDSHAPAILGRASRIAPRPSPSDLQPSPISHRLSPLARLPSTITHRPPSITHRLSPPARLPSTITHHPSAITPLLPAPPAVPPGELSLAFLTPADLARLHSSFLGDPSVTDVITFNGTPDSSQAGEICVAAGAAAAFAARRGRGFAEELTLYLVHGWLHLAGHDDRTPAQKRRMRAAEARAMALLQAHRLIPRFTLAG